MKADKPVAHVIVQKTEPIKTEKKKKRRKKKNRLGKKPKNLQKAKNSSLPSNVMSVDPVFFKYQSTELVAASHQNLDELTQLLQTYSAMGLVLLLTCCT